MVECGLVVLGQGGEYRLPLRYVDGSHFCIPAGNLRRSTVARVWNDWGTAGFSRRGLRKFQST
jgi:hypothetical protein